MNPGGQIPRTDERRAIDLLRLLSLRVVNDSVEQFHVFAKSCGDPAELERSFETYLHAVLFALRLRIQDREDQIEADILLIDGPSLTLRLSAGTAGHERFVPGDMRLTRDGAGRFVEPGERHGVATYAVWAFMRGDPGVAVARDVTRSSDIEYYSESKVYDPANKGGILGWYESRPVPEMYRPAPGGARPPYRSLLSTAIVQVVRASADPAGDVEYRCLGALNITHSQPDAFGVDDCAWARTCASLIGSLYECLESRRAVIPRP